MEVSQCGNLAIFLSLWFYVKLILADLTGSKTVILTILEALNFEFFGNFTFENVKTIQKFQTQSCANRHNGIFLGLQIDQNWFYARFESENNPKFPHCVFPFRLPRSVGFFKFWWFGKMDCLFCKHCMQKLHFQEIAILAWWYLNDDKVI